MILTDWLTVVGVCVLGAISPGPSLAIIIRHTLASGRTGGTIAAISHGLGVGLYAFICISGLAFVITTSPVLFASLQWVGAAYLLWLGFRGLTSKAPKAILIEPPTEGTLTAEPNTNQPHENDDFSFVAPKPGNECIRDAARDGFMIVFLNPKIAVFFIALFSQLVGPDTSPLVRTTYVLTALIIDAGWYLIVAFLFSIPLWLAKLKQNKVWFERLFGLILIGLAGRLVVDLL